MSGTETGEQVTGEDTVHGGGLAGTGEQQPAGNSAFLWLREAPRNVQKVSAILLVGAAAAGIYSLGQMRGASFSEEQGQHPLEKTAPSEKAAHTGVAEAIPSTEETTSLGVAETVPPPLIDPDDPLEAIVAVMMSRDAAICNGDVQHLENWVYTSPANTAYLGDVEFIENNLETISNPDFMCRFGATPVSPPTNVIRESNLMTLNIRVGTHEGDVFEQRAVLELRNTEIGPWWFIRSMELLDSAEQN